MVLKMANAPATDDARFAMEASELIETVYEANQRPLSAWMYSSGHLTADSIHVEDGASGGRVEMPLDEALITAELIDDPDRYVVNQTVVSQSYRTVGDSTVSVRTYRLAGVHEDTGEFIAVNHHTLKKMDDSKARQFIKNIWTKQFTSIYHELDPVMFLGWTQPQTVFFHGSGDVVRTAEDDNVTQYEVFTDLTSPDKATADLLYSELKAIAGDLKHKNKGVDSVDNYTFSLPADVINTLRIRDDAVRRLIDPTSAVSHNIAMSDAYDSSGLYGYEFSDAALGTFIDAEDGDGVYGYLHKRRTIKLITENYNRPELMVGQTITSSQSMAYASRLVEELKLAEENRDVRSTAILAAKVATAGFEAALRMPVQLFHLMWYPLNEANPYAQALIADSFVTPLRTQGPQIARLVFRNSRFPDGPISTPIPTTLSGRRLNYQDDPEYQEFLAFKNKKNNKKNNKNAKDVAMHKGEQLANLKKVASQNPRDLSNAKNLEVYNKLSPSDAVKVGHETTLKSVHDGSVKSPTSTTYVRSGTYDATSLKDE
jgi:hypothetical protein